MPNFELANNLRHLVVQPTDARLNPPESYLFVQDFLIISCGVVYALCYLFCMIRAWRDKKVPGDEYGSIQFLCLTMAYELYYAFTTTSTTTERIGFLVWFQLDITFVTLAIRRIYAPEQQRAVIRNMVVGFLGGLAGLYALSNAFPDDRDQVTAYWTGILLQLPIGWACLLLLWKDMDTRGHSLEIWLTRYLGCFTAYGVFFWRYLNAPENWEYVGSALSIGVIIVTLIPETIYPFLYLWVHGKQEEKAKMA